MITYTRPMIFSAKFFNCIVPIEDNETTDDYHGKSDEKRIHIYIYAFRRLEESLVSGCKRNTFKTPHCKPRDRFLLSLTVHGTGMQSIFSFRHFLLVSLLIPPFYPATRKAREHASPSIR